MDSERSIEEEVMEVNDCLIDTILQVCEEGKPKPEAGAKYKDNVFVTCTYRGICVEQTLCDVLELSKMVPLGILVPPEYPETPPIIWPVSLPEDSHEIDLAAREKYKERVKDLPHPLTVTGIGKLWDRCCRDAITDVAMQYGGGTFSSNIGVWKSSALKPP